MLGAFLFIRKELCREPLIFGLGLAAPARARDGTDGDFAGAHANQNFGARTNDLERSKIEVTEEGRGIDAAQRAIERKSGQREFRRKALRKNNLKDIASPDIFFRLFDHREETRLRRVRKRRGGDSAIVRGGPVYRLAFE